MIDKIIPISIFQNVIFKYCSGDEQIILKGLYYNDKLEITNLYDVDYDVLQKLSNETLKQYSKLKKLDISRNIIITNIDHLKNLKCLDISGYHKIDYESIKYLDLYELHIKFNYNIQDYHIENMVNLKILDISYGNYITNDGIKHMNLDKLCMMGTLLVA